MGRIGMNKGACEQGPLRTRFRPDGQPREIEDEVLGWNPRQRCDFFDDFLGNYPFVEFEAALYGATGLNALATTGSATALLVAPCSGYLGRADFACGTTLAADDTNYVSFSLINKLASGSGTGQAFIQDVTTTTSLTASSGLGGLTANKTLIIPALNLAAGLYINEGDVLEVKITAHGTLAAALATPVLRLNFVTLPAPWRTRAKRTGGRPQVTFGGATQNGVVTLTLDATSEAQYAGFDFGDQTAISSTYFPIFQARVKVATAPGTAQRIAIGLTGGLDGSNTELSTATPGLANSIGAGAAWFVLDANLNLAISAGTSPTQFKTATGRTLTAGTYYLLTIDYGDPANVRFFIDQDLLLTLNLGTGHSFCPFFGVQKDSGTSVPSLVVDCVRVAWNRM